MNIMTLEDLRQGRNNTVGALLIVIARTRLSNAGLDIPKATFITEPELTLYAQLEGRTRRCLSLLQRTAQQSQQLLQRARTQLLRVL